MIKLVQNELIKIFKRKSIYFLLIISLIAIMIFNYQNPDQNVIPESMGTFDIPISIYEKLIEKQENNIENIKIEEYVRNVVQLHFSQIYNRYNKDSWQRYALNEEKENHTMENVTTDINHDIIRNLEIVSNYEFNKELNITENEYNVAKEKIKEYIEVLDNGNWKEFVNLKIKNLTERKEKAKERNNGEIDLEIELYQMRINNNIEFNNIKMNQYIKACRKYYYIYKSYENLEQTNADQKKYMEQSKAKVELCKYAIQNNIELDIAQDTYNLITANEVDARNSLIRVFRHFDIIIVIIAIYISCIIITEEYNKGTIKKLFIKPHKRSTILISKIIACIITVIITILFVIISQYIVGGVVFGFDSYTLDFIGYDYSNEQVITMNLFSYLLLTTIAKLPMYIIIILFCMIIGLFNKNIAMSMILTLIIYLLFSSIIAEWSKVATLSMVTRYLITNNWDFSKYLFGQISDINEVNPFSSVTIYVIHTVVLLKLIITKFNNKEIINN